MARGPYVYLTAASPLTNPGLVLWFYGSVPVLESIWVGPVGAGFFQEYSVRDRHG